MHRTAKTISPNYMVQEGLYVYQCKVCKLVFKSLNSLSEHVEVIHRLKLILKDKPRQIVEVKDDDDDDGDSDDDEDEYEDSDDDDDDEDDVEEEGQEAWITDKMLAEACLSYANSALEYFNSQDGGKKYEFVQQGPNVATIPSIQHINFKAKEKDCPDALIETFFAQIRFAPGRRVDCCVSLGPSNELPHWRKADLCGCKLCYGLVHHPPQMVDNLRLK